MKTSSKQCLIVERERTTLLSAVHDLTSQFLSRGTQPSLLDPTHINKGNLNTGSNHPIFTTPPDGAPWDWESFIKVAYTCKDTRLGHGLSTVTLRKCIRSCHVLGGDGLCGRLEFSKTSWRRHCHSFEFYLMVESKKETEKQRNRVVLCGKNMKTRTTPGRGEILQGSCWFKIFAIGVQETGTRVTMLTFPVIVVNPSQRDF
jgi:hypothetical protein